MKCHYEVLGIERTADDKSIKNSYRKLALKFHPDKNPDNIEEAKQHFLLVQQAYDVLSDLQERAWYDNHRDQILRGSQSDYQDDSLDVFPYFTASCYKGFGDDPGGFYAVYNDVFKTIATEDIEFMDSPEDFEEIPKFGTSTSDYETVVGPFYAYWQSYCTKKTYSWLCTHNINEIRDRRILREIEKETKKVAQKAKKERNEQVRALLAFVRKRDKRVLEYKKYLEEKSAQNRAKQQQHRLNQLKKNQQAAEEMRSSQQTTFNTSDHEEQLRQLEQAYGSDNDYSDDDYDSEEVDEVESNDDAVENGDASEEEYYVDDLYCVACNKAFRNASSYENHESSKKHRDNLERLKMRMKAEEQQHQEEEGEDEEDPELEAVGNEPNSMENPASDVVDLEDEVKPTKTSKQKLSKKAKKFKNKQRYKTDIESDDGDSLDEIEKPVADISIGKISDEDNWSDDGKKSKKSKNSKKLKTPSAKVTVTAAEPTTSTNAMEAAEVDKERVRNKKGKKPDKKLEDSTETSIDTSHTCVTCQSCFDSKNKLFNHLKKTNHGVYLSKQNGVSVASTAAAAAAGKRGKKK